MIFTRGFEAKNPEQLKQKLAEFFEESSFNDDDLEKQGCFTSVLENGAEYEIPKCFVIKFQDEVNSLIESNNYAAKEYEDYAKQCRG